jgi:hypothetical protein
VSEITAAEVDKSFRKGAPAAPDHVGDRVPDSYSTGTRGPGNRQPGELIIDGETIVSQGEYGYGNPGSEMRARRRGASVPRETGQKEDPRADVRPERKTSAAGPEQMSLTSEELADMIWENGPGNYNYFVSPSLPVGCQWWFGSCSLVMLGEEDFAKLARLISLRTKDMVEHESGFHGDSQRVMSDPTFGPIMAMSGAMTGMQFLDNLPRSQQSSGEDPSQP